MWLGGIYMCLSSNRQSSMWRRNRSLQIIPSVPIRQRQQGIVSHECVSQTWFDHLLGIATTIFTEASARIGQIHQRPVFPTRWFINPLAQCLAQCFCGDKTRNLGRHQRGQEQYHIQTRALRQLQQSRFDQSKRYNQRSRYTLQHRKWRQFHSRYGSYTHREQ